MLSVGVRAVLLMTGGANTFVTYGHMLMKRNARVVALMTNLVLGVCITLLRHLRNFWDYQNCGLNLRTGDLLLLKPHQ